MDRKDFPEWCDEETISEILKAVKEIDQSEAGADTLVSGPDKIEE